MAASGRFKAAGLLGKIMLSLLCVMLVLELVVRFMHLVDVPVYEANNQIGYIPKPDQQGVFLRKNDWYFNEASMGTARSIKQIRTGDLLLVGDSIVFGGNPLRSKDKLAARLEAATALSVWPISAGSWAFQNELTYLRQHKALVDQFRTVVIVSNSGDFKDPSSWSSELTHPTRIPLLHSFYAMERFLLGRELLPAPRNPGLKVQPRNTQADFQHLFPADARVHIFLYSSLEELKGGAPCGFVPGWLASSRNVRIYCIADDPRWNASYYRDGMHPTASGNDVLARIISEKMSRVSGDL